MKPSLLLLALISAVTFTGCSTAYRTGQTPDDLYYATAKPQKEDDNRDRDELREEKEKVFTEEYYDDRFLRMKVRNYRQWSNLDDWYYYDKYSSVYSYYYGSYNNPYNSWNYYYNPYCNCHSNYYSYYGGIKYPANPPVVKRYFNLAGYTNTNYNNGGSYRAPTIRSTRTYNTTNNNNSNGGILKNIFNKDNSSDSRTYSPSTNNGGGSGNSGSGGSGGGSAPVTRPVRK